MSEIRKLRFLCVHGCQMPDGIKEKGDIIEMHPDQVKLPQYWRLQSKASFRQLEDGEVTAGAVAVSPELEALRLRLAGLNVQFKAEAGVEELLDQLQSATGVFTGAKRESRDTGAPPEWGTGTGQRLPSAAEIEAMDKEGLKVVLKELQTPFAHNTGEDKLRAALYTAVEELNAGANK